MSGGEGLGLGSVVVAVQWQLVLVRCEIFTCDLNCKWFPIIRRSPPLPGLMAFNSLRAPLRGSVVLCCIGKWLLVSHVSAFTGLLFYYPFCNGNGNLIFSFRWRGVCTPTFNRVDFNFFFQGRVLLCSLGRLD